VLDKTENRALQPCVEVRVMTETLVVDGGGFHAW
jgi:hypothetical protein